MKKILLTCHTLNPIASKAGYPEWKMAMQIARHQEVALVTRGCFREVVERYWRENDFESKENMQLYYYGSESGSTTSHYLGYYLWQWGVVKFIRKQAIDFDIAQDINLSFSWVPTFLWRLRQPLVWGPLGHQPAYPGEYIKRSYGSLLYGKKRLQWMLRQFLWKSDPFVKKAKEKATQILAINEEVGKVMNLPKPKLSLMPAWGMDPLPPDLPKQTEQFEILSAGPFIARNGFDLTIKSFTRFYKALPIKQQRKTRLTLLGNGPEEAKLKDLIAAKDLGQAIRILHCTKPAQLDQLYRDAALFLFPSHEGLGQGVPQALAYALPILCLDNVGSGAYVSESCGRKVAYGQYEHTVDHLTSHLHQLFVDKTLYNQLSEGAKTQFKEYFTWERKGILMSRLYAEISKEQIATPTYTS